MVQIVEQTHEEKVAMYMKQPKKKLADMLANCNLLLDHCTKQLQQYSVSESCLAQKCDTCGCTPSVVIRTEFGTFCQTHAKYVR